MPGFMRPEIRSGGHGLRRPEPDPRRDGGSARSLRDDERRRPHRRDPTRTIIGLAAAETNTRRSQAGIPAQQRRLSATARLDRSRARPRQARTHCTRCACDPVDRRSRSAALVDQGRILRQRMVSRRGRGSGSHRTCRTTWATLDQGHPVGIETGLKLQKATAARQGGISVGGWFSDWVSKANIDQGWAGAGAACEQYMLANCGCPGLVVGRTLVRRRVQTITLRTGLLRSHAAHRGAPYG